MKYRLPELPPLVEAAVILHEMYKSLLAGGFSQDEALTLIAKMIPITKEEKEE